MSHWRAAARPRPNPSLERPAGVSRSARTLDRRHAHPGPRVPEDLVAFSRLYRQAILNLLDTIPQSARNSVPACVELQGWGMGSRLMQPLCVGCANGVSPEYFQASSSGPSFPRGVVMYHAAFSELG